MPNHQLTHDERIAITNLAHQGLGPTAIGRRIGRCKSTVSRELSRNADAAGHYHHTHAQQRYEQRRQAASSRCWTRHAPLLAYVRKGINRRWSPEQISGRLARLFPEDPRMQISHESVYQWLYREHETGRSHAQKLRRRHPRRRSRKVGDRKDQRGQIPGRTGIEKRPVAVEGRRRFGDWESDTVEGAKGTGLLVTLVERKSRVVLIGKVRDKRAATVTAAIIGLLGSLPKMLRRTITADNGKEFAGFAEVDAAVGCRTYFANPHAPWERGANENTNGLLRDWFPKGSDFGRITATRVAEAQAMLNNRPRKTLDYRTPLEVINRLPGVALQI